MAVPGIRDSGLKKKVTEDHLGSTDVLAARTPAMVLGLLPRRTRRFQSRRRDHRRRPSGKDVSRAEVVLSFATVESSSSWISPEITATTSTRTTCLERRDPYYREGWSPRTAPSKDPPLPKSTTRPSQASERQGRQSSRGARTPAMVASSTLEAAGPSREQSEATKVSTTESLTLL
jgi:hypothetical protein